MKNLFVLSLFLVGANALANSPVAGMRIASCKEKSAKDLAVDTYVNLNNKDQAFVTFQNDGEAFLIGPADLSDEDNGYVIKIPRSFVGTKPSTLYLPLESGEGRLVEGKTNLTLDCVISQR